MPEIREIPITQVGNVYIGQTENESAGTGCTVIISKDGMAAGIDVRGGGPASRESELLKPVATAQFIHAIVLAGGSAFGLAAADGVMKYLEEHDIGFDVGVTKVPLVVQSDLFDLTVGDTFVRPDREMGYKAAQHALEDPNYRDGNYGAGCGATVGKLEGMEGCMKSGIGSYGVQCGGLRMGAIVAVNSLGDIFDHRSGEKIAGLRDAKTGEFKSVEEIMYSNLEVVDNKFTGNTSIGVIITNAKLNKTELTKVASMAQNGYARAIRPVHTSADGDSIYAVSAGDFEADRDIIGTLAAEVMAEAIKKAVFSAESAYGFIAAKDMR